MVSWQKFVSLCFEVKRERGNDVESLEEGQEVITIASDLWKQADLSGSSVSEAKDFIKRNA